MSIRDYDRTVLVGPLARIQDSRMKSREQNRPLTRKQRMFLEECLNSSHTFSDLMADMYLNGSRLAKWLMQTSFRKELFRIRRALSKQREMELAMGAKRGAEFLNRTFSAKSSESDRNVTARCRAAATLVSLARAAESLIKHERTPQYPPQRDLSDPDNSHAETIRLLNELEGKQAAD